MKPRISMINLGVRDLAAAVRFYQNGLGFRRMESPPELAFVTLAGSWPELHVRDALTEDATVPPGGSGFAEFTLARNVDSEPEANAVMQQALAAGATLLKPAQQIFCGGLLDDFTDPHGHLREIARNSCFQVGPHDEDAS